MKRKLKAEERNIMLAITEELGRFEEFFSDVIYPIWPAWLAGLIATGAISVFVAYRLGWHQIALRHRVLSGAALAGIIAISVPAAWYTVSPLFERETVCEASPLAGAGSGSEKCEGVAVAAVGTEPEATPANSPGAQGTTAPEATTAPTESAAFEPRAVAQGEFAGADDFHFGRGQALLIEAEAGTYTLRFEDFSVRNGPDLFVYLSTDPSGYSDDALLLGELKGTDGAFNYDVPPGTDVSRYKSAVVWCKQFAVLFATAAFA